MARTNNDRVKVNVYLPRNLLGALQRLAQLKGTTYSDLVRRAVHGYVIQEMAEAAHEHKLLDEAAEPKA